MGNEEGRFPFSSSFSVSSLVLVNLEEPVSLGLYYNRTHVLDLSYQLQVEQNEGAKYEAQVGPGS